jgi:hypothetical protein
MHEFRKAQVVECDTNRVGRSAVVGTFDSDQVRDTFAAQQRLRDRVQQRVLGLRYGPPIDRLAHRPYEAALLFDAEHFLNVGAMHRLAFRRRADGRRRPVRPQLRHGLQRFEDTILEFAVATDHYVM